MPKFAKGLWEVSFSEHEDNFFDGEVTCEGNVIAIVSGFNHNTYFGGFAGDYSSDNHELEDLEIHKANGRLIASAPRLYNKLEEVSRELYMLIDEVNDQRAGRITSQTESEPDYHDMQTLCEIHALLSEIKGECKLSR